MATYTATDAESDAVTWSLVDENDDDAFSIDSSGGMLSFQTPPDYEAPTAAGHAADADLATRNAYSVTVLAEDGQGASTEYEVTVTVTNVEEPGIVTLSSSQPQVGVPLRADLSDPDGGANNVRWAWLYSSARGARGVWEEPGGTDRLWSTFRPYSLLVGQQVRARAVYDDGQGADKQAQSALTEPVVGAAGPAPGALTAEVGDGQVALTWETPADNGSALTGYEYRHSSDGARTWAPDWGTIRDSEAETTSHRLERLTNGTEYTFEVRAVNAVGAGDSARGTATPGRAPDPVQHLRRAAAENGQVLEAGQIDSSRMDNEGAGKRVAQKLMSGTLVGSFGAIMGGFATYSLGVLGDQDCEWEDDPFLNVCDAHLRAFTLGALGYTVGGAIGVHRVDPYDRFIPTLAGSASGFIAGLFVGIGVGNPLPLLLGPPVLSAIASEWWRKPPEPRRFSVGLVPDRRGRLSAVATLRF